MIRKLLAVFGPLAVVGSVYCVFQVTSLVGVFVFAFASVICLLITLSAWMNP